MPFVTLPSNFAAACAAAASGVCPPNDDGVQATVAYFADPTLLVEARRTPARTTQTRCRAMVFGAWMQKGSQACTARKKKTCPAARLAHASLARPLLRAGSLGFCRSCCLFRQVTGARRPVSSMSTSVSPGQSRANTTCWLQAPALALAAHPSCKQRAVFRAQ